VLVDALVNKPAEQYTGPERGQQLRRADELRRGDAPGVPQECERDQFTDQETQRNRRAHYRHRVVLVHQCQRRAANAGGSFGHAGDQASRDIDAAARLECIASVTGAAAMVETPIRRFRWLDDKATSTHRPATVPAKRPA
jgi:hypothetical protein